MSFTVDKFVWQYFDKYILHTQTSPEHLLLI